MKLYNYIIDQLRRGRYSGIPNLLLGLLLLSPACRKTQYNVISSPAYIRVFNSLNYTVNVTNKDQPPPFLAMVIDPVYDGTGLITGGNILGDFLDKRSPYAPAYPVNAGNTSFKNTEYPGSVKVLAAPIVNGINLSSWAQVPSGNHRIVFYNRPISSVPFFSLGTHDRQNKLVDTTVSLTAGEVYTMEVLLKNVYTQIPLPAELYVRQEQFTKVRFSDSMLYVNFYNLGALGYAAANPATLKLAQYYYSSNAGPSLGDTLNIYYSLLKDDCPYPYTTAARVGTNLIPGYNNLPLGTVIRSHGAGTAPYFSMPMFAAPDTTGGILSREWELFVFMAPGIVPLPGPLAVAGGMVNANPLFGAIGCSNLSNDGKGSTVSQNLPRVNNTQILASFWLPNLIKYSSSGIHLQQSFATISTIEIINNQVYLMSVQRTYLPPVN
jgi:hypothetical protein